MGTALSGAQDIEKKPPSKIASLLWILVPGTTLMLTLGYSAMQKGSVMDIHQSDWTRWPVAWSAIWVGALTALAVGLIIGLVGYAVGANEVARYVDWKKVRLINVLFSVGGAFFAFVAGGWTAGRIAGIRRSEPAILHGAIVWLVGLPLLIALAPSAPWPTSAVGMGGFRECLPGPAPPQLRTPTSRQPPETTLSRLRSPCCSVWSAA
jgi:hypothetical protein